MTTATKTKRTCIARGTSNAAFTQLTGCSVTRSGTTATLTKTSHGLSTSDKVLIQGFSLQEFNGVFTITVVDANTFTYTISADPSANPSGTPGTVDKVTLGTAVDLTTAFGGIAVGDIQNGTSGPGVGGQLWMGLAAASGEANYIWRPLLTADVTANALTPFQIPLDKGIMYVNFAVARNTTNAVDCNVEIHELTSF